MPAAGARRGGRIWLRARADARAVETSLRTWRASPGHRAPRLGAAEAGGLVVAVELLECRQVLGDVANMHALADLAPEAEPAPSLLDGQRPPAEAIEPAQRLERESRQHVEEILIRDAEAAVNGVHPGDGALPQI